MNGPEYGGPCDLYDMPRRNQEPRHAAHDDGVFGQGSQPCSTRSRRGDKRRFKVEKTGTAFVVTAIDAIN
jgi:hypothetical protein